ncbi:MAG: FAD-dependent thymidylate synthase [Nitrososphaerota archaeon]
MKEIASMEYLDKGYIKLFDLSDSIMNERTIYETIGNIATLSYGNEYAKNPYDLGKKIENLGHLSVLEFIRAPIYNEDTKNCIKSKIEDSFRHNREILNIIYDENVRDSHKHCLATFRVKIPIFVARQLMRHRCFSFLELSRRYVTDKKREFEFYNPVDRDTNLELYERVENFYKESVDLYNYLRENNIPSERSRVVIPVSTYTEIWLMGCRECLDNFFKHRLDRTAQREIRELAEKMFELLSIYQREFVE